MLLWIHRKVCFGTLGCPMVFRLHPKAVSSLLQGIPGVVDDILISMATEEEHLKEVVFRLWTKNLRVKKPKCKFMAPSVQFLGYDSRLTSPAWQGKRHCGCPSSYQCDGTTGTGATYRASSRLPCYSSTDTIMDQKGPKTGTSGTGTAIWVARCR